MATLKSMVADKLGQKGENPSCGRIREIVRRMFDEICKSLPDGTLVGDEYARAISKSMDRAGLDPVDVLVESVMEDRDDLCDYPLLRRRLECAIKCWK